MLDNIFFPYIRLLDTLIFLVGFPINIYKPVLSATFSIAFGAITLKITYVFRLQYYALITHKKISTFLHILFHKKNGAGVTTLPPHMQW